LEDYSLHLHPKERGKKVPRDIGKGEGILEQDSDITIWEFECSCIGGFTGAVF